MRPAHPPDPRNVDRRVTRANSRHTSYTNERLEALGVSSPPRSGWRPLAAVLVVIALVLIGFYWTDLVSFVIAIMNPQESPCTPVMEDFTDILGPPYPAQSLNGSRYRTGPTTGGVPHKRALSPPCFVRNTNGEAVPTLVEVHGVYLRNYSLALYDCSDHFKYVNGGAPYPNNQVFCDNVGDILVVGTTTGQIHIEFDQDWQAKGLCGPAVRSCDTIKILDYRSNGNLSLDFRGYVYWDDEHWELHPATAWKLSSDPVWA